MEISSQTESGVGIVTLNGSINLYHAPTLQAEMKKLIEGGVQRILVDMSNVPSIDSSGIGALINVHRTLKGVNGMLGLVNAQPSVMKVFDLTKLRAIFTFYDTMSIARSAMQ